MTGRKMNRKEFWGALKTSAVSIVTYKAFETVAGESFFLVLFFALGFTVALVWLWCCILEEEEKEKRKNEKTQV